MALGSKKGWRRKRGLIALAAVSTAAASFVMPSAQALPAGSGDTSSSCSTSGGTLSIALSGASGTNVLALRKSRLALDGASCARLRLVDTVAVRDASGRDARLVLVVPARGFTSESGELTWDVDLGDGSDSLVLKGRSGDNSIDVAGSRVNFNSRSTSSFDLVSQATEGIELSGGAGDDRLRSSIGDGRARSSDGGAQSRAAATASLGSYPTARISGGTGNDTINGDNNVNVIFAGAGNDTVYAKGADDEIQGGGGNDLIYGGDGDDLINGGPGDDREFGTNNNDLFQQGPQEQYLASTSVPIPDVGRARSSLFVPPTSLNSVDVNVRIYVDHARPEDLWTTLVSPQGAWVRLHQRQGGNGSYLDGTQFDSEANTNIKNLGSRSLSGRFHPEWSMELVQGVNPTGEWQLLVDDKVAGTTGTIRGWELELGMPTDAGDGADQVDGGTGAFDLVVYTQRTQSVNATLLGNADDGQAGENDSLGAMSGCPATLPADSRCANLEWAYGGSADDTIVGTDEKNDLRGFGGHDTLIGLNGPDDLRGVNGRDAITAGAGDDVIHGQANPDTIDGGEGFDRAIYGYAPASMVVDVSNPAAGSASDGEAGNDDDVVTFVENVTGSNFDDRILGARNLKNVFVGGPGDDFLNGGTGLGNDELTGSAGTDTCLNGETVAGCEVLTVEDTQPPSTPTGLAANVNENYDVNLTWSESTDNIGLERYAVYRDGALLAYSTSESYTDPALTPGATHSYTVSALDGAGNESAQSDPLNVVADNEVPTAPTGLSAELDTNEDVSLTWQAATDDVGVVQYGIYRDGQLLDHSADESYLDQTALHGQTYSYKVTALDSANKESAPSEPAEITIGDVEPPTVPQNVSVRALSTRRLEVSWSASTDDSGAVTYDVYRGEELIGSTTETTFVDSSLAPGTTATYSIKARDGAGNASDMSASAGGTTYALLFDDDFSSGNFSKWSGPASPQMTIVTPGDSTNPAARAHSDGTNRSFLTKALVDPQTTIFYKAKVRINAQSNPVNLLRLQNTSGTPIVTVFASVNGNVMLRNDVTGTNSRSAKTFDLGAWHDLQLRVTINGASSETEVWLDGARIGLLSGTHQLGTNPVGQLMLGDNLLNRSYTVLFDDVAAAAGYID